MSLQTWIEWRRQRKYDYFWYKGFSGVDRESTYVVHCKENIYAATGSRGGDVSLNRWCNEPSFSRIQDVFHGSIPGTSLSATWRDLSSDNMRKRSC